MLPGIDAAGEELAGRLAALPSVFQTHVRIHATGEALLLPVEAILKPPPLAAGWRHF